MTIRQRQMFWFLALYGLSLAGFAILALLVRMLLQRIV